MTLQSEAILENNLIAQLNGLGYASVPVPDGETLVANLKTQLEKFNNTAFTTKEFNAILNHLAKGNVFEKAKTLRDRFNLSKEDGTNFYVRFFNNEVSKRNFFVWISKIKIQSLFKENPDQSKNH